MATYTMFTFTSHHTIFRTMCHVILWCNSTFHVLTHVSQSSCFSKFYTTHSRWCKLLFKWMCYFFIKSIIHYSFDILCLLSNPISTLLNSMSCLTTHVTQHLSNMSILSKVTRLIQHTVFHHSHFR